MKRNVPYLEMLKPNMENKLLELPRQILLQNTCDYFRNAPDTVGTAFAISAKFRGIRPRMYIEDLL